MEHTEIKEPPAPFYIPAHRATFSRLPEVDWDNLEFGRYNSDHMLVCDYAGGKWQTPQVLPFGDFAISPATLSLHYGQTIFEGMKAFRMEDGRVNIFRPRRHYERFALSAERLCMPVIPPEIFVEGLRRLVEIDKNWVPGQAGSALYLRPFMIATEARLRVKVSESYRFSIITTPTCPYYQQPLRVKVETDFVRAVRGGTGYAKCGGNYGGSLYPAQKAKEQGYDQVLWTDGIENKYIEESGAMNVFFVIDDTLVTPPLSDSILDGITRDSLITLAGKSGIRVEEKPVAVEDLRLAFEEGRIREAFGSGTAAVISPIGTIGIGGTDYDLPAAGHESMGTLLRIALENIRYGCEPDLYGWNYLI